MRLYRARFRLRSAVATPWQSDTIFGHLCWALRHRAGPEAVGELLDEYRSGRPPFLISHGFPADHLPRPLLPARGPDGDAKSVADRRSAARLGKEAAGEEYLSVEEFNRAIRGEPVVPARKEGVARRAVLKNQISRATGTTGGEGSLYEMDELFSAEVSIYVRAEGGGAARARELLGWLAEEGYGKRRSAGYGEVASLAWEDFDGIADVAEPNGFVSLSSFVPARGDPREGSWRTLVKYGKLGEEYATSGSPFKRPVVMLTAGSCLYDPRPRAWYGRLVGGVSRARPEVAQYGLALAVPARLRDRGG